MDKTPQQIKKQIAEALGLKPGDISFAPLDDMDSSVSLPSSSENLEAVEEDINRHYDNIDRSWAEIKEKYLDIAKQQEYIKEKLESPYSFTDETIDQMTRRVTKFRERLYNDDREEIDKYIDDLEVKAARIAHTHLVFMQAGFRDDQAFQLTQMMTHGMGTDPTGLNL